MIFQLAPIEPVSSQRSKEIKARTGIAIPNTKGQFAPNENKIFNIIAVLFCKSIKYLDICLNI